MRTAVKSPKRTYKTLLLKKREELRATARSEALATSLQTPDEVEFAAKTAEQDVTVVTVGIRSRMLQEVETALRRVDSGTYGECEGCGQSISPARLKAIPWARYCLICQELRSRN